MNAIKRVFDVLTCRDLTRQIEEASTQSTERYEKLRAQPKANVQKAIEKERSMSIVVEPPKPPLVENGSHCVLMVLLAVVALAGCAACPPGTAENAENVRIITADNEALLAKSDRSDNEKTDIRLHNQKAVELANAIKAACQR